MILRQQAIHSHHVIHSYHACIGYVFGIVYVKMEFILSRGRKGLDSYLVDCVLVTNLRLHCNVNMGLMK